MKLTIEICTIEDVEQAKKMLDAYAAAVLAQPQEYGDIECSSQPITSLMLPTRALNALLAKFGNIPAGELAKKTKKDLLAVPNFGCHSLAHLKLLLADIGLELRNGRYGGSNV